MVRFLDVSYYASADCHALILHLSAIAIDEILCRAKWCVVRFADALDQLESIAEFIVNGFGAVTHNVEAVTFLPSVETERRNNNMTAAF